MAAILATFILATTPITDTGGLETGWASQYAPGVMERVIFNRQNGCCGRYALPLALPAVDGYVAAVEPEDIGKVVWLRPHGRARWEKFLVTDCAGKGDRREYDGLSGWQWMKRYGVLVEVDHQTAARWSTVGRLVEVQMRRTPPEWKAAGNVE